MNSDIKALKRFGQNFLIDKHIINTIINSITDIENSFLIEIGPGKGALTKNILLKEPNKLIAIEFDKRLIEELKPLEQAYKNTFFIINDDAVKINESELIKKYNTESEPVHIVSNLPYNISTVLLVKWLENIQNFNSLTLMFQKEVGERITAKPGSKKYGRLSVMANWLMDISLVTNVSNTAFYPAPKVKSQVLKFVPKKNPIKADFKIVEKVVKAGFSQRRKMIKSSLKTLINDNNLIIEKLKSSGIKPNLRAEQLSVNDFLTLANELSDFLKTHH